MFPSAISSRHTPRLAVLLSCCLLLVACGKKETPTSAAQQQAQQQAAPAPAAPVPQPDEVPAPASEIKLPTIFGRHTGDLDEMAKNRNIRALVLINPISFFYDKGHPKGITYEALEEFQKFVNQKLKTGTLDVKVSFLPLRPDQIEPALAQGVGDLIAYGLVITPEREQRVAFSTPIQKDVSQIIVTGPDSGPLSTLADLGGKEVYVNPLTTYYTNLQKVNETLQKEGKTPIVIKAADKNLLDDDLVQMVNAGLMSGDGHHETEGRPLVEGTR